MATPAIADPAGTEPAKKKPVKVLTVFGTRPEAVKLAPVVRHLNQRADRFQVVNVSTGQHRSLLKPFIDLFGLEISHDLDVLRHGQTPNGVFARVLNTLEPVLARERPDVVLVQGDTTSATAGALVAFHAQVPVGHVEAGLRSGNANSPFPEEMNRRLVSRIATFHYAATHQNRARLRSEGISDDQIFVTGNPVVEALSFLTAGQMDSAGESLRGVLDKTAGTRRLVVTSHRRENFGERMANNFKVLRSFVSRHPDVSLIFPVHPNPRVQELSARYLADQPRIHLIDPLGYFDFLALLSEAWLIASDSGGVQEEAPSLGKPLLVLRENTERPESIESGVARLVGDSSQLEEFLEEASKPDSWACRVGRVPNPFGDENSGRNIVESLERSFGYTDSREMASAV